MARLACWRVSSSESACPARRAALSSAGRRRARMASRTPSRALYIPHAQGGGDRAQHQRRVREGRQLDQPDALRERGSQLAGEAQRQRRLPRAASAGDASTGKQLASGRSSSNCTVVQADGGTRTAGVTGAYVVLAPVVHEVLKAGKLTSSPLRVPVAAQRRPGGRRGDARPAVPRGRRRRRRHQRGHDRRRPPGRGAGERRKRAVRARQLDRLLDPSHPRQH